ncbi:carboxypeptidase-like protein [Chitinophaga japonensis]|uniref:Carboxypeptidase-like protein n=1 Tax=Chitinophaga japonensis TaxID=104662 RepID=A0A562T0D5_CHIJA|nr:carboxypeptidase-like protein [Chitinophaga japonensis]
MALLSYSNVFPQDKKIEGTVKSVKGETLPYATVTIRSLDKDAAIIAFAQTNANGYFKLNVPVDGNYLLNISMLGYEAVSIQVNAAPAPLSIVLTPRDIHLREVIVKDFTPVKFKNDTTSYTLSHFSDGTERNMEEVLKKLPGIRVSDNGTITFNGKSIDRILIDGEDFFSRTYKVLSKNITPGLVEKVDAIENFNEEKLLKGIQRSDKVVLNFNFRKKLAANVFGSGSMGGGIKDRYIANTTLFSFLNKTRLGVIGNINNVGIETLDEAKYNLNIREVDNPQSRAEDNPLTLPVDIPKPFVPNVDQNRYLNNRARLGAVQVNHTFSSQLKLNAYGYLQRDRNTGNVYSLSRYFLQDSILQISESGQNMYHSKQSLLRSRLEYAPDSLSVVRLTGLYAVNDPYSNTGLVSSVAERIETINGMAGEHAATAFIKLGYLRRLSAFTAINLEYERTSINTEQTLLLHSDSADRYTLLFAGKDSLSGLIQQFKLPQYRSSFRGHYMGVRGKHSYEASMTLATDEAIVRSDIYVNGTERIEEASYRNDLHFKRTQYALEARNEMAFNNKVKVTAALSANNIQLQWRNKINAQHKSLSVFFLQPAIAARVNFKRTSRLSLSAVLNTLVSSPTDLYTGWVFTDYRNVLANKPEYNISREAAINIAYVYFSREKYLNLLVSGDFRWRTSPYIINYQVNELLNIYNRTPANVTNANMNINAVLDKFIYTLKSRAGLRCGFSDISINRRVNNAPIRSDNVYNYGVGGFIVTAFDKMFNFSVESKFNKIALAGNNKSSSFNPLILQNKISVKLSPVKSVTARISFEEIRWPNLRSDFLDAVVIFTPRHNTKYSFEIRGTNLLNTSSLSFDNITNTAANRNIYSLVPRIIYGSVLFNIGKGR